MARKINSDDIKGPVGAATATAKAEVREAYAFTGISSSAASSIGLTHNQTTLLLTDDGPEWTLPAQSSVAFPDNFRVKIVGVSGFTLTAEGSVTINGVGSASVSGTPASATLIRQAEDVWVLELGGGGSSSALTVDGLITLLGSATGTPLNNLAAAIAAVLATGLLTGDAITLLTRYTELDPEDRAWFLGVMAAGTPEVLDGPINPGEFWTTDTSGNFIGRGFGGTTLLDVVNGTTGALPPDAETLSRSGLTYWKKPVRVATTGPGTLATSFDDGSTVDGVTLATGDRILIKDQSAGAENGIYDVQASGAPVRANDADAAELLLGCVVLVTEGTTNGDEIFTCTDDAITLETTGLTFVQKSGSGGSGFSAASTTEVLTGTDTSKGVTADALAALWEQGSNIASSSTISVGEGGYFIVTGTTDIDDIDLAVDRTGRMFALEFADVLTLTHSSTLVLPGEDDILTEAGGVGIFVSKGSDVIKCIGYSPQTFSSSLLDALGSLTAVTGGEIRLTGASAAAVLKTAEYDAGNTSGAVTLDLTDGLIQRMTLTGNVTDFNPPTATGLGGDTLYGEFIFEQDGGGTNTVSLDAAIELEGPAFEGGWDGPDTTGSAVTTYAYKIGPSGLCIIYDRAVRW